MLHAANNSNFIRFRFTWADSTETSIKVRLSRAGLPAAIIPHGDPAQLPDFALYRSIPAMRAEAQLFAAMRQCKLRIEEG